MANIKSGWSSFLWASQQCREIAVKLQNVDFWRPSRRYFISTFMLIFLVQIKSNVKFKHIH